MTENQDTMMTALRATLGATTPAAADTYGSGFFERLERLIDERARVVFHEEAANRVVQIEDPRRITELQRELEIAREEVRRLEVAKRNYIKILGKTEDERNALKARVAALRERFAESSSPPIDCVWCEGGCKATLDMSARAVRDGSTGHGWTLDPEGVWLCPKCQPSPDAKPGQCTNRECPCRRGEPCGWPAPGKEESLEDLWRRVQNTAPTLLEVHLVQGQFRARLMSDLATLGDGPTIRAGLLALLAKLTEKDQ